MCREAHEVAAGSAAVDVACGYTHTVVLTASGELYSWGLGEYGQLGTGDVYQPLPARVQLPSDALCAPDQLTRVYCGAFHSIATTEKRVMFAWGLNSYGACGLGHTANKDKPERIDCFSSQTELVVACGHKYTIALEVDPALYGHSSSSSHAMVRTGAAVDGLAIPRTQRQVSEGSEASEDDPFFGRGSPGRPTTPTVGTRRHRRGSPPTLAMDLGEAPVRPFTRRKKSCGVPRSFGGHASCATGRRIKIRRWRTRCGDRESPIYSRARVAHGDR